MKIPDAKKSRGTFALLDNAAPMRNGRNEAWIFYCAATWAVAEGEMPPAFTAVTR